MHSEIDCIDHHHSTFLSPYPEQMGFDLGDNVVKHGRLLIRDTDLQHTVAKIAATIINGYAGKDAPHFLINIRNGSLFGSDLLQRISIPVTFDFMMQHEGKNEYFFVDEERIKDKTVIIVNGPTNDYFHWKPIMDKLYELKAKDVQYCAMTLIQRNTDTPPETFQYIGYLLTNVQSNMYLVGYGAGRKSKNQNVKALYAVES